MTSSLNFVLVAFGVVAVGLGGVHGAISDEDRARIHTVLLPFVAECTKEYSVSEEALKAAKASGHFENFDPCLLACIFQKIKLIDEKGLFDVDKAVGLVQKYISNEDDQKKVVNVIETCKSVNDEEVSDGEKGCERSRLLFECSIPFRGEFIQSRR